MVIAIGADQYLSMGETFRTRPPSVMIHRQAHGDGAACLMICIEVQMWDKRA
jgi:hypothetical protein